VVCRRSSHRRFFGQTRRTFAFFAAHGGRPLGIVGLLPLLCSPFQMVDEGRFERLVAALAHDFGRLPRDEHFPGMHQRDAVAALGSFMK